MTAAPLPQADALDQLWRQLDQTMIRDTHRLRRELERVRRAMHEPGAWERLGRPLQERLASSVEVAEQRRQLVPNFAAWPDLPIVEKRGEIEESLRQHPVIVVCGETGSGKSTQLPKFCLEMGRGVRGMIGHTQPRRLAARSIATRLASELQTSLGHLVGYQVRFQDETTPQTLVKLMTDGILLAETQTDRFLNKYDTIILDEAHERSLNVDFLIGYLTQLLAKRHDLRVIVTSATIDAPRFAEHFQQHLALPAPPPIVEVSGRTYPVEVRYRHPAEPTVEELRGRAAEDEDDVELAPEYVADLIEELLLEGPGDMLVFLPTEREIRELAKVLRGRPAIRQTRAEVLPLYARLPSSEQQQVFQVSGQRRVVLATNVAESSLTVPGIRYVVDTGTARIGRYSPKSKVQRLPIERVSRASADQRKGRCGRIGPGICVRTYPEADYESRDAFTDPEIRRTNLAGAILRMLNLQLGDIEQFPLIDPPRPEAIRDGYRTLFELGAVDNQRRLTDLGRQLGRLPVDPRIARMILAAVDEQCLAEILILASVLEIQDPRERPVDKQAQADAAHAQFVHPASDFLTLLNIWDFFHRLREDLSRSKLKLACRQNFLSLHRLHEWSDLYRQLRQAVHQAGWKILPRRDQSEAIHRALLTGLTSNIAQRGEGNEYQGAGGGKFFLWPGSALFEKRPQWVVAAELVETSKRYLRTVAGIQPEWLERLAAHLVRKSYSDPHWSKKASTVMAHEKVTLFGLVLVAGRRRPYAHLDPPLARRLFIEEGLVEGHFDCRHPFHRANQDLLQQLESQADKTRSRDFIVGIGAQYAFYDRQLPSDVYDGASLDRYLRQHSAGQQQLTMTAADLLGRQTPELTATDFPEQLQVGPLQLPIDYAFQPGEPHDGMTITVPAAGLNHVSPALLDWAIPGLLVDKLVALIRTLPKPVRRQLIPAPDVARQAAAQITFGSGDFYEQAAKVLSQLSGERITPADFDRSRLPEHLRMNVRVVDDAGEVVAEGRDLDELKRDHSPPPVLAPHLADTASQAWHRTDITAWDFGDMPEFVEVVRGGHRLQWFPGLEDQGDRVAQQLYAEVSPAVWHTRRALARLFALAEKKALKSQVQWLPGLAQWEVTLSTLGRKTDLRADVMDLLARRAWERVQPLPRQASEFAQLSQQARLRVPEIVQEITPVLTKLFAALHQVQLTLAQLPNPQGRHQRAADDMRQQLAELTEPHFLANVPWPWLQHVPRYLQGIVARCEKLSAGGAAKDAQSQAQLQPWWDRWLARRSTLAPAEQGQDPWLEYRWMLEELRVSLFAQQLGTAHKVSPQRVEKLWPDAK